jgi:hypothetical protein
MRVSYAIFNRRGSSRLIPRGEAWQWHWHLEDDADLADLVNSVAARLGRERLELLNLRVSHTDAVSMEIIRPLIAYLRFDPTVRIQRTHHLTQESTQDAAMRLTRRRPLAEPGA